VQAARATVCCCNGVLLLALTLARAAPLTILVFASMLHTNLAAAFDGFAQVIREGKDIAACVWGGI
jgi:hypothetical protein